MLRATRTVWLNLFGEDDDNGAGDEAAFNHRISAEDAVYGDGDYEYSEGLAKAVIDELWCMQWEPTDPTELSSSHL